MKSASVMAMLLIIIAIYASTTVYWSTVIHETFRELLALSDVAVLANLEVEQVSILFNHYILGIQYDGPTFSNIENHSYPNALAWWTRPIQQCAGTATLTVNVSIHTCGILLISSQLS